MPFDLSRRDPIKYAGVSSAGLLLLPGIVHADAKSQAPQMLAGQFGITQSMFIASDSEEA